MVGEKYATRSETKTKMTRCREWNRGGSGARRPADSCIRAGSLHGDEEVALQDVLAFLVLLSRFVGVVLQLVCE